MKKVFEIFEMIENTSSRNEKEQILIDNKDNELLKRTLFYIYNPYYIYGVGKKSLDAIPKGIIFTDYGNIFDLLDYLKQNNGGSNEAVLKVHGFLSTVPTQNMRNWYRKVILKDLKIGITEKTINKIWKKLIPAFDVMLAKKYEDYAEKIEGKEFIVTTKLDGVRAVIMKDYNGSIKIMSRQGKVFEDFIEIEEEVQHLPSGYAYDGEFLAVNDKGLNSKELYKATTKITNKKGAKKGVEFHCFDMMPLNDFREGKSTIPCLERKQMTMTMESLNFRLLKAVPILYIGNDVTVIKEYLDDAIVNGQEGVMVNLAYAPYECKRSANILKVKQMYTMDLKVIGFEKGDGKFSNSLGRMNVDYKGNIVGVGSGFSEEMRDEIWNNQEKYLGAIAEIQYFEVSSNQKGSESLRFPVFKTFRFDKDVISHD